jgi:hypothetical protein
MMRKAHLGLIFGNSRRAAEAALPSMKGNPSEKENLDYLQLMQYRNGPNGPAIKLGSITVSITFLKLWYRGRWDLFRTVLQQLILRSESAGALQTPNGLSSGFPQPPQRGSLAVQA